MIEYIGMAIVLLSVILLVFFSFAKTKYDRRGFDQKGLHRNGTRFDNNGYDVRGFDADGYDEDGYDIRGYDVNGYNEQGYDLSGRNVKGKYNRLYDIGGFDETSRNADGFLCPDIYPVRIPPHAEGRIYKRQMSGIGVDPYKLATEAYCFGKSVRQIRKTDAAKLKEMENRHDSIALIYHGYIYFFTEDNVLKTVIRNERNLQ